MFDLRRPSSGRGRAGLHLAAEMCGVKYLQVYTEIELALHMAKAILSCYATSHQDVWLIVNCLNIVIYSTNHIVLKIVTDKLKSGYFDRVFSLKNFIGGVSAKI